MRRRLAATPAWVLAAGLAVAYLAINPPSADLAAQLYRTDLFRQEGFGIWDGAWYGGHHLPGYSVVYPALAALLGPRVVGALAAVAAAALFERLVAGRFPGARIGSLWFAAATATNLVTGRLTFGLGVAVALGALLAEQHRRPRLAAAIAVLAGLSSPVAGAFLAMGGVAWWAATRRRTALGLAFAAIAPVAALTIVFPEGGTFPFVGSSFWPTLLTTLLIAAVLPRQERVLRAGSLLYALALVASFVIDTPMGGNTARLGALFGGPLVACALWDRRHRTVALVALPLLYWQWLAPIDDWVHASRDASVQSSYYRGMLGFLESRPGPPFRVEIPFTDNHWESYRVGRHLPLARGWERQVDRERNTLFYDHRPLTAARYRRWLDAYAVRYVALPDAPIDHSAADEAALIRRGPDYLRAVWRDAHWRVFAVRDPTPPATGARVLSWGADSVTLAAPRAGRVALRVRWTPYWLLAQGHGCVARAPGDWTELRLRAPGPVKLVTRFALSRIAATSPRCTG